MYNLTSSIRIFKEGGQSVEWFTELEIIDDSRIKIISHYRLFYNEYENWPNKNKKATSHPKYYGSEIYRESEKGRIATHYNLPSDVKDNNDNRNCEWHEIVNPQYIFSYD